MTTKVKKLAMAGDERVRVAELKHMSEFRIGSSVLLLSVTSRLAPRR